MIGCWLFGHWYEVHREFGTMQERCIRCGNVRRSIKGGK